MAVAFRSDNDVTNGTAGTSVTVTKPSGIVDTGDNGDRDHLIAFIGCTGVPSITPPADWNLVATAASGSDVTIACYEKLADSEGANWTWTLGASQRNWGWVGAYTGVDPDDAIEDSGSDITLTGSTLLEPTPPDIKRMGLGVSASATSRTASGSATTWTHTSTERADLSTNAGSGTDVSGVVGDTVWAGAVDIIYAPQMTASQNQTAGAALAVTLNPYFQPYSGEVAATGLILEAAFDVDPDSDIDDWVWTDLTNNVFGPGRVTLTHGRSGWTSVADPMTLTFALKNINGEWTSPNGTHYGKLVRSLPFRVRMTGFGTGVNYYRGTAFLSSARPAWDDSTNVAIVQVEARGRLSRLQRGGEPLKSAAYRSFSSPTVNSAAVPVDYWPFEDESDTAKAANAIADGALGASGLDFAADDSFLGSAPLAQVTTSTNFLLDVRSYPTSDSWAGVFAVSIAEPAAATTLMKFRTSGTARLWSLHVDPSTDTLVLNAYDGAGASLLSDSAAFTAADIYGIPSVLYLSVTQDGTGIDYVFGWIVATTANGLTSLGGTDGDGTLAAQTCGALNELARTPMTGLVGSTIGHVAAYGEAITDIDAMSLAEAVITGHTNEMPHRRVERLCVEEGIPFRVDSPENLGSDDLSMGPQGMTTLIDLFRECETADGCVLNDSGELLGATGLVWFPARSDRDNADLVMTLDIADTRLVFQPSLDEAEIRNDVEVTRPGGSSARVTDETSIALEGRYRDQISANLNLDKFLRHVAGYRVGLGTVRGMRLPTVGFNLRHNPALAEEWVACTISSRVDIANPPSQYPPDVIRCFLEGWTETIGADVWEVRANLSLADANHVFVLAEDSADADPFLGRLAGDEAAAIRAAIDDNDTTILVDPNRTRFTTVADDFDPDIEFRLGGEVVTVSGIATTAGTFVAAGAASNGDNSTRTPSVYAGDLADDLIIVVAAIRSSGTGTVDLPTGYTRLPIFPADANVAVFAKVHDGSEANPSVSFTGGSAGDTTTAFTFGLRGTPVSLADLTKVVVDTRHQINASAGDIAYPGLYTKQQEGCIQIIIGWKQDDYTSVAVPTGFTEIIEASTTTANDQSLYVAYRIDTTPAVVNGGSLAVTGGASAISRAATFALAAGYQTFTVSARSVNSVTKSHAAGTRIEVEDPAVLAL